MHARTARHPHHVPTLAERRAGWRAFAAAAVVLAERVLANDGRERLERSELPSLLGREGRLRFPIEDASAGELVTGFRNLCRAALIAGTDRRRAVLAPALLAAAQAVDQLLTDQGHDAAERSRLVSGERPDRD